jgi:regulatory protein
MKGEADPYAAALAILARRDRTESELRRMLGAKGFASPAVAETLERLRRVGYVNDGFFARRFAAAAVAARKAFGRRLLLELERRGISRDEAAEAVREATDGEDEESAARELLHRRYPAFPAGAADERERRRMAQFLLRRGFRAGIVYGILRTDLHNIDDDIPLT